MGPSGEVRKNDPMQARRCPKCVLSHDSREPILVIQHDFRAATSLGDQRSDSSKARYCSSCGANWISCSAAAMARLNRPRSRATVASA